MLKGQPDTKEPETNAQEMTSQQTAEEYKNDGDETESNPDPGPPPSYEL